MPHCVYVTLRYVALRCVTPRYLTLRLRYVIPRHVTVRDGKSGHARHVTASRVTSRWRWRWRQQQRERQDPSFPSPLRPLATNAMSVTRKYKHVYGHPLPLAAFFYCTRRGCKALTFSPTEQRDGLSPHSDGRKWRCSCCCSLFPDACLNHTRCFLWSVYMFPKRAVYALTPPLTLLQPFYRCKLCSTLFPGSLFPKREYSACKHDSP